MVSIREYVTYVSKHELKCYIQQNMTEKEECEYYISEDYEVHLNYLIESWITNIKNELNDIECNEIFQDRARKNGLFPFFNDEWLDDIFESDMFVTPIYLK